MRQAVAPRLTRLLPPLLALTFALASSSVPRLPAEGIEPALVPVGALWHYRLNSLDGPPPPANWFQPDFDDSAWPSGRSGFGTGLGDEVTVLTGSNLVSACFRTRFTLGEPAAIQWLLLRLDYHSGYVAWLNGQEVARRGPLTDPPAWDELVPFRPRPAMEEVNLSSFRTLLRTGTNVLAIQVHGYLRPAPALALIAELRAHFSRGPYVQQVGPTSAHLLWQTVVPTTAVVEYGLQAEPDRFLEIPLLTNRHHAVLTNLPSGTLIHYRVRIRTEEGEALSPPGAFRTAPLAGPVRFAVLGDSGSATLPQLQVASCLATAAVDLVLHTGDLVYPGFTRALADLRLMSVYEPIVRNVPWYPTPGNHDLYGPELLDPYFEIFLLPTNPVTGTAHFYSFDFGDAHFVSLFVPTLTPFRDQQPWQMGADSPQLPWLAGDLASTDRPWRIVFLHSPLFHSGGHRYDDYNFNGVQDRLELQAWLLPILTRYGVQAVFSGHDHSYERLAPIHGVHAFVTGGGGYTLYALTERDRLSLVYEARFHHLECEIDGDTLHVVARDRFGNVFDTVTIPKVSPPTLFWVAPASLPPRLGWNSAPGETYELQAAPAPTGPWETLETIPATDYQTVRPAPHTGSDPAAAFFRLLWRR